MLSSNPFSLFFLSLSFSYHHDIGAEGFCESHSNTFIYHPDLGEFSTSSMLLNAPLLHRMHLISTESHSSLQSFVGCQGIRKSLGYDPQNRNRHTALFISLSLPTSLSLASFWLVFYGLSPPTPSFLHTQTHSHTHSLQWTYVWEGCMLKGRGRKTGWLVTEKSSKSYVLNTTAVDFTVILHVYLGALSQRCRVKKKNIYIYIQKRNENTQQLSYQINEVDMYLKAWHR